MNCPNPKCHAELKPGAVFCPSCGARVECCVGDVPKSEPPAGEAPTQEPAPAVADAPKQAYPRGPFDLAVAKPRAMKVKRESQLKVRFRAKDDIYESVEFVLRRDTEEIGRANCCDKRPGVTEHQVSFAVVPNRSGKARFILDVKCCVGGREMKDGKEILPAYFETHTAEFYLDVEEESSTPPAIYINQTNSSDRAGDTRGGDINVNLGGRTHAQQEDTSWYDVLGPFETLTEQITASPGRLTLMYGDEVLQLVSDDRVTFGRNRDNTIPIRVCGDDGREHVELNCRLGPRGMEYFISRSHFTVERSGSDCVVRDGVDGKSSSTGTNVGGLPLSQCGTMRLVPEQDTVLEAGHQGTSLKMSIRFHRDKWGRSAGFVLDRHDGARQRVCAVWRNMPIDGGGSVSWSGSRWLISSDGQESVPIVVGTSVNLGGKSFFVLPFRQTHVN